MVRTWVMELVGEMLNRDVGMTVNRIGWEQTIGGGNEGHEMKLLRCAFWKACEYHYSQQPKR